MSFLFQLGAPIWPRGFTCCASGVCMLRLGSMRGQAYKMQLAVMRMILVRAMLRISFTRMILIVVMIATVQLQFSGTGNVWGSGSAPRREYNDPDPLHTMIRIRGRRRICKISACGICIPHCTKFYISQILRNHSATRIVFQKCQNTQQQKKITCCGQRKQPAYILRCGGNIKNYVLVFLQQKMVMF